MVLCNQSTTSEHLQFHQSLSQQHVSKWNKCHQMEYNQQFTCVFCDQQQTLGHVIGGFKTALLELRYNRRHDFHSTEYF